MSLWTGTLETTCLGIGCFILSSSTRCPRSRYLWTCRYELTPEYRPLPGSSWRGRQAPQSTSACAKRPDTTWSLPLSSSASWFGMCRSTLSNCARGECWLRLTRPETEYSVRPSRPLLYSKSNCASTTHLGYLLYQVEGLEDVRYSPALEIAMFHRDHNQAGGLETAVHRVIRGEPDLRVFDSLM